MNEAGEHVVQLVDLGAVLKDPVGQLTQTVELGTAAKVPAGQIEQAEKDLLLATLLAVPTGQGVQELEPRLSE